MKWRSAAYPPVAVRLIFYISFYSKCTALDFEVTLHFALRCSDSIVVEFTMMRRLHRHPPCSRIESEGPEDISFRGL